MHKRKTFLVVIIMFLSFLFTACCTCPDLSLLVPKGTIVAWYDSVNTVPNGWVICDGNNHTPDLRDNYILGATYQKEIGSHIGSNKHSHTVIATNQNPQTFSGTSRVSGNGTTENAVPSSDPMSAIPAGGNSSRATGDKHQHAFNVTLDGSASISIVSNELNLRGNTDPVTEYPKSVKIIYIMKL